MPVPTRAPMPEQVVPVPTGLCNDLGHHRPDTGPSVAPVGLFGARLPTPYAIQGSAWTKATIWQILRRMAQTTFLRGRLCAASPGFGWPPPRKTGPTHLHPSTRVLASGSPFGPFDWGYPGSGSRAAWLGRKPRAQLGGSGPLQEGLLGQRTHRPLRVPFWMLLAVPTHGWHLKPLGRCSPGAGSG